MKISPINNVQPAYKAKVVQTPEFTEYLKYLNEYSKLPEQSGDFELHKKLTEKIMKALEKFPSEAEIRFSTTQKKDEIFNTRGVVESQYAKFTDTEPARNDTVTPIINMVKRILHPDNKSQFNKLMNNTDMSVTNRWWGKYIFPIWEDMENTFRKLTFFEDSAQYRFNEEFRKQH